LKIRAIENGIFMVAVNKAGDEVLENEPRKRHHFGKSCVINPAGDIVLELNNAPNLIFVTEVELKQVDEARVSMDWFRFRKPELYKIISNKKNGKGGDD